MNRRQFLQTSILSTAFLFILSKYKGVVPAFAQTSDSCLPMCLPGCLEYDGSFLQAVALEREWAYGEPLPEQLPIQGANSVRETERNLFYYFDNIIQVFRKD